MSNTNSAFTKAVINAVAGKEDFEFGPLLLIKNYEQDIDALLSKVRAAAGSKDITTASIIREYFAAASPEGEKLLEDRANLAEQKVKSPSQRQQYITLTKRLRAVEAMLLRTVQAFEGITALRSTSFSVHIENVRKSNALACYVTGKNERIPVAFTIKSLMKLVDCTFSADTAADDVLDLTRSNKQGAANKENKANGERIAPAKLGEAVRNIDTSIAAVTSDNGKLVIGNGAKSQLLLLWARLDATLTDDDKMKARAEFNGEGDDNAETVAA